MVCLNVIVEDLTSTRDEDISLYISQIKPYFINWFYEVEFSLKSTS